MNIREFAEKNRIAIIAKADLNSKDFEILKRDIEIESYDLFEQLVLYGSVDSLMKSVEGQIMPRIWSQGNTKCVVSMPNNEQLFVMFFDSDLEAKDNYFYAKQLDSMLKDVIVE